MITQSYYEVVKTVFNATEVNQYKHFADLICKNNIELFMKYFLELMNL